MSDEERRRLREEGERYRLFGPYLSERQWGTVREDYSADGNAWEYFPHEHARSRAYRWGEDGLAGISDEAQRLCLALALWNEKDAILKERLFGLTNSQGNHGEDVKELYYYLDATPTHSYLKYLYKPPPDPNAPPASSTTPTTLAVQRLFLGDTDLGGNPDPSAWRKLGFNIDGLVSDKTSINHCKYQLGATKSSVQTDGENGIDNSFGSNLVKIIASLMANPSQSVTDSINGGGGTWLLHLPNLGSQPSQNGVTAAMFSGAKLGFAPAWQGGDVWPVTFESVVGGNIAQPLVTFPQSYVVNGVWVGAPAASGALDLVLDGQDFGLGFRIHHPRVTAQVIGTGPNAKAVSGVISGVIDTEEYVAMLKEVAGSFDQTLCEGATFESIAQQIRAASDIMNDGSNGDPSKICNGISIGLGFEAMAVKLGPVAGKAPPPVQYCK